MKKLLLSLALSASLAAGTAIGASPNHYQEGLLIPHVTFSTTDQDFTTLAVVSRFDGNLHWAFFDENGNRLAFGQTPVLADSRTGFNWQTLANGSGVAGLDGKLGFLLFTLDTNTDGKIDGSDSSQSISGNAFLVNLANKDAAFVPTFGVDQSFLSSSTISGWTDNPITSINNPSSQAVEQGNTIDAEFLIDGAADSGDNTFLVFWHVSEVASTQNATIHDGAGTSKAITLQFLNDHLNVFDLETVTGVSAGFFGGGFVRMTVPSPTGGGNTSMTGFSAIEAPFVGANQTVLFDMID